MIGYDFSRVSARRRTQIYNLFSPTGRAHLAHLLRRELDNLNRFVMSYETPELRRLEAKGKRVELTLEEEELLARGAKSFKGLLDNGDVIEDEKALQVIGDYMLAQGVIESDYRTLETFIQLEGQQNSEIILGRQLSYWNLHPNQFPASVYEVIFDAPDYVKQEILKIQKIKQGRNKKVVSAKVFSDRGDAVELLRPLKCSEDEKQLLAEKLMGLNVVGEMSYDQYRETLVAAVNATIEKDNEFDYQSYKLLKSVIPNYHNQKTKYLIYMLAQYNQTGATEVNSRLDFDTLLAFYRKADELCS